MTKVTRQIAKELGVKRSRVAHIIRYELGLLGSSYTLVAQELGLSYNAVLYTVRGKNSSARILAKLREIGVPEKYLHDPHVADNNNNKRKVE